MFKVEIIDLTDEESLPTLKADCLSSDDVRCYIDTILKSFYETDATDIDIKIRHF